MLPTLLASLFLPGARAGSCADSATLDYPAGLDFQRGSFAPPYEPLGGSAGLTISAWVYRERTKDVVNENLVNFYDSAISTRVIALTFSYGMKYEVGVDAGASSYELAGVMGDPSKFPSNQWVHVSLVHNPTTATEGSVEIRWNGVVQSCSGQCNAIPLPRKVARDIYNIGTGRDSEDPVFQGKIRDLYVWNAAISATELDALRLSGTRPATPPVIERAVTTNCLDARFADEARAPPPVPLPLPLNPSPSRP